MEGATTNGIRIIYEDNHLLAVEKPVNILSQGDGTGDRDLLSLLKEDIKIRFEKPGEVYLGLVHRLDRPVGGVMVFARTSKAAARLSEQIRQREFKKTYLAVLRANPPDPQGRLEHYLLKDSKTNIVKAVKPDEPGGKEAILDYRIIGRSDGLSLVGIDLHTGRSHQIRVQFSSIGCPLFGDLKYGADVNRPGEQLALWSARIVCAHPTRKISMTFESRPPEAFPWDRFASILDRFGDILNGSN